MNLNPIREREDKFITDRKPTINYSMISFLIRFSAIKRFA